MLTYLKNFDFGKKKIQFFTLEEIAEVKTGLSTGDNKFFIYKKPEAIGSYSIIDTKNILSEKELLKISNDESLRKQVYENGISKSMFNGKTIIPHDKGGSSDIEGGVLNNYFSPTEFFIDWSEENVRRLKSFTIADVLRYHGKTKILKQLWEKNLAAALRNKENYFREGITFPKAGIYVPTFRINSCSTFDSGGNCLFIKKEFINYFSVNLLLGILCSKFIRYLIKNFLNNSINMQVDDLKKTPIVLCDENAKNKIEMLVSKIILKQKENDKYEFHKNEQLEIDEIIYEIYGLDEKLITEVENWYSRKYPKLVI